MAAIIGTPLQQLDRMEREIDTLDVTGLVDAIANIRTFLNNSDHLREAQKAIFAYATASRGVRLSARNPEVLTQPALGIRLNQRIEALLNRIQLFHEGEERSEIDIKQRLQQMPEAQNLVAQVKLARRYQTQPDWNEPYMTAGCGNNDCVFL